MIKLKPKLSDMPKHIKQSITDDLDTGTKLSLRQVDREFREVVGNSKIYHNQLIMSLRVDQVELNWRKTREETVKLLFKPKEDGFEVISDTFPEKTGKGDYRKAAVAKMFSVFKNSKVSVGELKMEIAFHDYNDVEIAPKYEQQQFEADKAVILEEIGRILPLKNFRLKIGSLDCFPLRKAELVTVLPYLEPGILKVFWVARDYSNGPHMTTTTVVDDQTIVDTDQWRQLKEVRIASFTLDIPFEKYSHIEYIDLRITSRAAGTMKTLLEKVLQTPTIKECWLNCRAPDFFDTTDVDEYVDQFEKIPQLCTDYSARQTCIKNSYEAGEIVTIKIRSIETLSVVKSEDKF